MFKNEADKNKANLRVKDLLMNAAAFKTNPNDYSVDEACPICMVEFEKDQNVINLPCNKKHIFHDSCIGEWIRRNNTCPLCKAPITAEAIRDAELGNIPFMARDVDAEAQPLNRLGDNGHEDGI